MGRASSRLWASIAQRALLLAAACLLAVGAAPAFADGPLGLDAKVDVGGTVSGTTGAAAGAVPQSVGALAAPASQSAPTVAKAAADTADSMPVHAHATTPPRQPAPAAHHSTPPAPAADVTAGARQTLDAVAPGSSQAAGPVTPAAAPAVEHVDRVARTAAPVVENVDRLVGQVAPLLRQVDPLLGGLSIDLAPAKLLLGAPVVARSVLRPATRLLGRIGASPVFDERPTGGSGTRGTADVEAPSPGAPSGAVDAPSGSTPRAGAPSSVDPGSTTLAPRPALRPPLSLSVPGGAPAGGSGGFFFSPFLALLVLLALTAPTLLRRFELPPAFLRPALFACTLERPG